MQFLKQAGYIRYEDGQLKIKQNLQRIKQNFYWQMQFLKQAGYIRYAIASLSNLLKISMLTSTESFLQMIP